MKLSVIIPVFNEQDTIETVLQRVAAVSLPCGKEIIVIDDGSEDETKKRIKKYESSIRDEESNNEEHRIKSKQLTTIFHQKNTGKGSAVQSGIKKATGDYILIQDADLEYNPEEIPRLLEPVIKNQGKNSHFTAVYGSRFQNGRPAIPFLYYLGNMFLTALTNFLYGTRLTDMETGYKLLPAAFAQTVRWKSTRFDIEPEITAQLVHAGIRIVEVPIQYHGRTHLAGKKLTARDATGAIIALIKNRTRFHLTD